MNQNKVGLLDLESSNRSNVNSSMNYHKLSEQIDQVNPTNTSNINNNNNNTQQPEPKQQHTKDQIVNQQNENQTTKEQMPTTDQQLNDEINNELNSNQEQELQQEQEYVPEYRNANHQTTVTINLANNTIVTTTTQQIQQDQRNQGNNNHHHHHHHRHHHRHSGSGSNTHRHSHRRSRNSNMNMQYGQQQEDDSEDYKNWIFVLIIVVFLVALLLIFISFIGIVIKQTYQIKGPHYEIIKSSKSSQGIEILASCKKCHKFYNNPDNLIAKHLNLTVKYMDSNTFEIFVKSINFTDEFQIPYYEPFFHSLLDQENLDDQYGSLGQLSDINERNYLVSIRENPLELIVKRKKTNEEIFFFSSLDLIYSTNYKEILTRIPSNRTFGIGERNTQNLELKDGVYTMWNQRNKNYKDYGKINQNINGYHPFYLQWEQANKYHGVYLRASNAIDLEKKGNNIVYKIWGGILNYVFFLGDGNPSQIVEDYHTYLGGYQIPPFWSLGIHHLYQNFASIEDIQYLIKNYTQNSLQLDVIWLDQSYLHNGEGFNYDKERFPIQKFQDTVKDIKIIPSMQPGIKIEDSVAYIEGVRRNIFIKDKTKTPLSGKNREGAPVLYPDFFSPQSLDYWDEMFENLYNDIKLNGLYFYDNEVTDYTQSYQFSNIQLDMEKDKQNNKNQNKQYIKHNHKANLSNQKDSFEQNEENVYIIPSQSGRYNQNFTYTYLSNQKHLEENTIDLTALHYNNFTELNVHNLFCLQQAYATNQYLSQWAKQLQPFIISKATFPGIGRFAGHLASLPECSWKALQVTIPQLINFNIFGIPVIGYGICFTLHDMNLESTYVQDVQLISRWLQISVVFPFFLNHNDPKTLPIFKDTFLLMQMQNLEKLRYTLSVYIYTIYFTQKGSIYQPLFFLYPDDTQIYTQEAYLNEQFLVGKNMMICPIVHSDKIESTPYFPQDDWFDFKSGIIVKSRHDPGGPLRIYSDISSNVPIFIRGGSIIPLLTYKKGVSLEKSTNKLTLQSAFRIQDNGDMYAEGYMLGKSDYGEGSIQQNCVQQNCLVKVQASVVTVVERPPLKSYYYVSFEFSTIIPDISVDSFVIDKFVFFNLQENKLMLKKKVTINSGNAKFSLPVYI